MAAIASASTLALALLLDHVLGRAADEFLVGELGVELPDLGADLVDLALEPLLLGVDVDDAGERQRQGRLVEHDLHRARRRLAEGDGVQPREALSSVSWWRATRARVSSLAPEMTSGTLAPAGTFISARTERTSEMSRISQPISASASAFWRP